MSTTILHVDSSPLGDHSTSRKLTAEIVEGLRKQHADARVIHRDLSAAPLPHLSALTVSSFFTPAETRSAEQAEAVSASEQAVEELLAADVIVIGAPMWNFGIPSSLKAWIDHVVRAGKTFRYGANGPEGLVKPGTRAIVALSSGGVYSTGPMAAVAHHESYLRDVFRFIGLTDVTFVHAEGLAMGDDAVKAAMAVAAREAAGALRVGA